MKKIALFVLLLVALSGCGKDYNEDISEVVPNDTIPTVDSLELFYQTKTFGFRVQDTTNLDLIHSYILDNSNSITFLTGRRNKKIWIAKFDTQTKEQLFEFVDDEILELNQKIHAGYGEYKEILVLNIQPIQFIEKEDHKIINTRLDGKEDYIAMAIFNCESANKRHIYYNNSNLFFLDWYNKSHISNTAISSATIFDKYGNVIYDGIGNYGFPNVEMTVNYTDYLWVGFLWQNDTQPTILRTWLGKHSLNNNKWSNWLPILKGNGAKYEYKITSKNGNVWAFTFDVLEYSGEHHSHEFKININTGELQ